MLHDLANTSPPCLRNAGSVTSLFLVDEILRCFDKFRSDMNVNFRNFRISSVMIVWIYFSSADSNSAPKQHHGWQRQIGFS